jgi:hypothetical protein
MGVRLYLNFFVPIERDKESVLDDVSREEEFEEETIFYISRVSIICFLNPF